MAGHIFIWVIWNEGEIKWGFYMLKNRQDVWINVQLLFFKY